MRLVLAVLMALSALTCGTDDGVDCDGPYGCPTPGGSGATDVQRGGDGGGGGGTGG